MIKIQVLTSVLSDGIERDYEDLDAFHGDEEVRRKYDLTYFLPRHLPCRGFKVVKCTDVEGVYNAIPIYDELDRLEFPQESERPWWKIW
jgi:hypothetical protein